MDFDVHMAKGLKDPADWAAENECDPIDWALNQCKDPIMQPKYDGWHVVFMVTESGVRTYAARRKLEYTGQVPEIEAAIARFPVGTVIAGELVAMEHNGERWESHFKVVGSAMTTKMDGPKAKAQEITRQRLRFVAFDLIRYGDTDCASDPQRGRHGMLAHVIDLCKPGPLVAPTIQMPATQANHDMLIGMGFEGSIVRDQAATYAFGKKGHGLFKLKGTTSIDVVVMELPLDGKGQFEGQVGKMVCGQYRDGELVQRLKVNAPNNAERLAMTNRPDEFLGRTVEVKVYGFDPDTGNPRHPSDPRWRPDKAPTDCVWSDEQ